jgi:hypothetical protein
MTCANRTWPTVSTPRRWSPVAFIKAILAITEVFQEASEMRRAAHRSYFLSDE